MNPENQNTQNAPVPSTTASPITDKRRHFLAVFFYSFLFGVFGVDRFYLGKIWTGLLKLLTFGGFGIWAMIDLSLVISGKMKDKQGNEMIDAARYKKLAKRTVWIFSMVSALTILVIGSISIFIAVQFMQGGGLNGLIKQFLPTGTPGLEQLQNIQVNSQSVQGTQDLLKNLIQR